MPIIFHNLRGFDGHLIMQALGTFSKTINVIPSNMEKYMDFMISDLVFIDSFQFMSRSFSNLSNDLSEESFHHAKNDFNSDALELIIKKETYLIITLKVLTDSKRSHHHKMNSILN